MLTGLHNHTSYTDGRSSVEKMAAAAFRAGFTVFGFSEHSYTPMMPGFPGLSPKRFPAYREDVLTERRRYAGRMNVFLGLELDALSAPPAAKLDYTIGSVHAFYKGEHLVVVDESAEIQRRDAEELYGGDFVRYACDYFETAASSPVLRGADIIGHIDLVTKFNEGNRFFSQSDGRYLDAAFSAVDELCRCGVIFEINTGAMSRGYRTAPYPSCDILRRIRERGGRITVSSDAHDIDSLAFGYSDAAELARNAGFTSGWTLARSGFVELPLSF